MTDWDAALVGLLAHEEVRVSRLADMCSRLLLDPPAPTDPARLERIVLDLLDPEDR